MTRTGRQNNSIHLLCQHLADQLNDAGLDMKKTLKPHIDIPWSKETVKEYLFKPIVKAQYDKDSTTQLETHEVDKVFQTLSRHLGDRFGIELFFPSVESLMNQQRLQSIGGELWQEKKNVQSARK
jgi:hypothetical protein